MAQTCTLGDLRSDPVDVLARAHDLHEPVFVDVEGRCPAVIVDADMYLEAQQALGEFKRIFMSDVHGKPRET
jgi:3-methyladenine DNA glycosylase Tag